MAMVFDKPQWQVKPVQRKHQVQMKVRLEFFDEEGNSERHIFVHMPNGLPTWLRDVACVKDLKSVSLFVDKIGRRWILGVNTPTGDYDLWYYTKSTLPHWIRRYEV